MIGVFGDPPRLGRRDGDEVVDLSELGDVFRQPALNALMAQGRIAWEDAIERAQAQLRARARLRRRHVRPRPNGTVISRGSLGEVRGRVQAAV